MITAQLATIPGRENSVRQTIESLLPQVYHLFVVLNGDCDMVKLFQTTGSNKTWIQKYNEYGDAAKFLYLSNYDGYLFTCDDDLIYPPDYVETMIAKIEQYGRKALITCHGRTFPKRKITSYYRDKLEGFRCLSDVAKDTRVDSGGTGVMAWHSDLWQPSIAWFKTPNMADVWIAVKAIELDIPIICIEHREGWIKATPEGMTGLWDKHYNDDKYQTEIFNSVWYD